MLTILERDSSLKLSTNCFKISYKKRGTIWYDEAIWVEGRKHTSVRRVLWQDADSWGGKLHKKGKPIHRANGRVSKHPLLLKTFIGVQSITIAEWNGQRFESPMLSGYLCDASERSEEIKRMERTKKQKTKECINQNRVSLNICV